MARRRCRRPGAAVGSPCMFETWYAIAAIMFALYVALDGFDLGAGIVSPFVARGDTERRQVLAAIGPYWDGNEVWLVAAGGALFLAFPRVLASGISGFYFAIFLFLWCLLGRGIAIEFRSHVADPLWRAAWDFVFVAASTLLAVFFGAAFGNLMRGVSLDRDGWFALPLFTDWSARDPVGILDWYTVSVRPARARSPWRDVPRLEDRRTRARPQPPGGVAALDRRGRALARGNRREPRGESRAVPGHGPPLARHRRRPRCPRRHRGRVHPARARRGFRSVPRLMRVPARHHRGQRGLVLPGDAARDRGRRPVPHRLHGRRRRGEHANRAALVPCRGAARLDLSGYRVQAASREGGGRGGRRVLVVLRRRRGRLTLRGSLPEQRARPRVVVEGLHDPHFVELQSPEPRSMTLLEGIAYGRETDGKLGSVQN